MSETELRIRLDKLESEFRNLKNDRDTFREELLKLKYLFESVKLSKESLKVHMEGFKSGVIEESKRQIQFLNDELLKSLNSLENWKEFGRYLSDKGGLGFDIHLKIERLLGLKGTPFQKALGIEEEENDG